MRLCLVSDSHRHRHELLTAVKSVQRLDAILHAGDETSDADWLMRRVNWPVYAVAGNWDTPNEQFPAERVIDAFGPRIFLTHGHHWKVKYDLQLLGERAVEIGARIVVYGHTHKAQAVVSQHTLFVNPGSLAQPRGSREKTFAVLEIDAAASGYEVRCTHVTAQGEMANSQVRLIVPAH